MTECNNYNHNTDGKNIPSSKKNLEALECDTFRDDVRAEWIRAVFGTEFPLRKRHGDAADAALPSATTTTDPNGAIKRKNISWKGVGLAGISSYVAYTANLELPRTSTSSSSLPPGEKTLKSLSKSTAIAANSHCNNDSDLIEANGRIYIEKDEKASNEKTSQTPLHFSKPQQLSLGMTLSRLSLGLYVRTVLPGSEAWFAGVEENSVLVGINDGELNLLAEPSKSALERIWQYEGYCSTSIDNAGAKDKASKQNDKENNRGSSTLNQRVPTSFTNTKMKIRDPISMTFIRGGKLYKVLFLSDPPYGIDWGPCGKFCLVQRVKTGGIGDRAGVLPSSIVARIDTELSGESNKVEHVDKNRLNEKNTIYHLDHSSVAAILKNATASCIEQEQIQNIHNRNTIRVQLCFPPSEARSGHWERQQDDLEENGSSRVASGGNSNAASSNNKTIRVSHQQLTRPRVAAEFDGVQVRIHPFLGGRGKMVSTGGRSSSRSLSPSNNRNRRQSHSGFRVPPSSALSKLADRVAAGENLSMLRNSNHHNYQKRSGINSFSSSGAEYGRYYRPCPILKKSSSSSQINTNTQQYSRDKKSNPPCSLSPSVIDLWDAQQALIYIFRHHLAGYDEVETRIRASEDTDFLKVLTQFPQKSQPNVNRSNHDEIVRGSDVLSTFLIFWFGWVTSHDNKALEFTEYALKLVHQNQMINNKNRKTLVDVDGISHESSSSSLAYHMEFLAWAFDNGGIQTSLQRLRKERQQEQHVFETTSQIIVGSSKGSDNTLPSLRAVTGTTPTHHETPISKESEFDGTSTGRPTSDSIKGEAVASVKPQSRHLFRYFRKKNRRRVKKKSSDNASTYTTVVVKQKLSLPSVTGDEKSKSPAPPKTNSPSIILKELKNITSSKSTDCLFGNTLSFLEELELVCVDIEKSLMRSFSQKFARWALQPWTANKESALANVTNAMRERLNRCNQNDSSMPLLDPIDSSCEPLTSIDSNECYILPSAHFPLLLTFDCKRSTDRKNNIQVRSRRRSRNTGKCQKPKTEVTSNIFGDEYIYRTTVELVALKGLRSAGSNRNLLSREFIVHGSVSGSVCESQQSVEVDQESNHHIWKKANVMVFDSRSTWGPPKTLSLRLSETTIKPTERQSKASTNSSENICCYFWVDLTTYWEQSTDKCEPKSNTRKFSYTAQAVLFDAFKDFNEHGDLPDDYLQIDSEVTEIEITITTKILKTKTTLKRSLLYKHDDDVRQEMFAIEFIKSCDRILRSCGLDMKMLVFRCIAVGKRRGFIEWVQGSLPLSAICQPSAGSILAKRSDKKKKLKSINIDNSTSEAINEEGDNEDNNEDDDNITLSSVAMAGMTKYESLSRPRPDNESSSKQPNASSNYMLSNNSNPIQDFLRSFAYDHDGPYKIKRGAMDTYVKSCAGYSVCTYVLGVGDRHLDNLLLHESGHFFHCDYSFILGNDPKKYLPMRITQDMINGMGGWKSDNFCQFLSLVCAAFLTLRRPENMRHLLSLIRLLGGCGLPDLEGTQTIETAIQGVRDRLKLDLSDEEAIIFMEKLIQDSCSSKIWIALDAIHSFAKKF